MRGRQFLDLAREILAMGSSARHWRAVIIHTYYALLLECRDTMASWGFRAPSRHQVHAQVRLRLVYSGDPDLKRIGFALEHLGKHRNSANYDLGDLLIFASAAVAQTDANNAADALDLLDAIDRDPVRQAAAIASINP